MINYDDFSSYDIKKVYKEKVVNYIDSRIIEKFEEGSYKLNVSTEGDPQFNSVWNCYNALNTLHVYTLTNEELRVLREEIIDSYKDRGFPIVSNGVGDEVLIYINL